MGFRVDHTLMMNVDLGLQGYTEERGQQFYKQISERVEGASWRAQRGLRFLRSDGVRRFDSQYFPDGQVVDEKTKSEIAFYDLVQPDYFGTAGVRVVQGREVSRSRYRDVAQGRHCKRTVRQQNLA